MRRWRWRVKRAARRAALVGFAAVCGWLYVTTGSWVAPAVFAAAVLALAGAWRWRPRHRPTRPRLPVGRGDRAARLERTPTHLYFWWDGPDLIYVGITNDADRRIDQHGVAKPWVRPGVVCEMRATFPTRSAALAAEEAAIRQYRPTFNKVHNGSR